MIEWSDGKAFVATGIPSDNVDYKGVSYQIGQANNALIYPGLGLGMLASEAKLLTDEMIGAAAHSLSGIVDSGKLGAPVLPPFAYVAEVSSKVAEAVAKKAQEQGLAQSQESDMKKAAAIQRKFIPKVNALFSYPSPAPVKAVLNYMGFEAGPTRLPLVPAPAEEAKRIIKVVVDGDYHATKEIITGVLRPDY